MTCVHRSDVFARWWAFSIREMNGMRQMMYSVLCRIAGTGTWSQIVTGDRRPATCRDAQQFICRDDQNYIKDEDVVKKLGVPPKQVVDYKAIVGDKSDNIPGVAGVGEKTAIALLEKYKTLDNIYKHIDEVENRWKAKLEANKANAYLSRDLAQIKTDLNIKLDLEHARAHDLNVPAIEAFFKELEFRSLLKTLEKLTGQSLSVESPARHICRRQKQGNRCPCL
jgi:DNA polymerase-1